MFGIEKELEKKIVQKHKLLKDKHCMDKTLQEALSRQPHPSDGQC